MLIKTENAKSKLAKADIEKIIHRARPSQIPTRVIKQSYIRMLGHCTTEGGIWACKKSGARVKGKMVIANVFRRDTEKYLGHAPVVHLYCSGCDPVPAVRGGASVWAEDLQTVSM